MDCMGEALCRRRRALTEEHQFIVNNLSRTVVVVSGFGDSARG